MFFDKRHMASAVTLAVIGFAGWNCSSVSAGEYRAADVNEQVKHLGSDDQGERTSAITRLSEMKSEAKSAIGPLTHILETDPAKQVRGEAAQALGNMGPAAVSAVPALIAFLKDTQWGYERTYGASALGDIGMEAETAVPALIDAMQHDEDPVVQQLAARALAGFGAKASAAVLPLVNELKNGGPAMRNAAAYGLERIPARPADVAALQELLGDEIDIVRESAARSIGGAGSEAASAVPQLVRLLSDKNNAVQVAAAIALGNIGPEAKAALPALKMAEKDAQLAWDATNAIQKIKGK